MDDLLIRNADIVDPVAGRYRGSVAVRDGRIAGVLAPGEELEAREVVDAAGRVLMPGVIDPHTHIGFANPFAEDVRTETRSAALGGVTTVMSFHRQYQGAEPRPYGDLAEEIAAIEDGATVDVGLHLGILTESQVAELERYITVGVSSFKFYMAYRGDDGRTVGMVNECDDGVLLEALEILGRHPHATAGIHAENTEIVRRHLSRAKQDGRDGLRGWHEARPQIAEAESVRRVCYLARQTGARVYIVHVGSPLVLEAIEAERSLGTDVWVETCPHYLACDVDSPAGNLAKINPPVRTADDVAGVWQAVLEDRFDTVGTDHCATAAEAKEGTIWEAAAGFPGMATMLPILLSEGHHARGLDLVAIARLTSYHPARAFNLLPRKGVLRPGADADLVLVDLGRERSVHGTELQTVSGYSIHEGSVLRGWPTHTFLRGQLVAHEHEVLAAPGTGAFARH